MRFRHHGGADSEQSSVNTHQGSLEISAPGSPQGLGNALQFERQYFWRGTLSERNPFAWPLKKQSRGSDAVLFSNFLTKNRGIFAGLEHPLLRTGTWVCSL